MQPEVNRRERVSSPAVDILSEPHPTRTLLRLSTPMIGVMLSRMAMGFVDFVMVSHLGTSAQAAISPATLFVFALGCLGMGVAQAVQTFVAQSEGRNEPARCGAFAWQTLYIAAGSAVLTTPLILTLDVWFGGFARWAGHPPDALHEELAYLRVGLWSIVPATLCMGMENFFNGIQRPRVSLIAVLASLGANVVGNYALIFGHWGFPALGIAGAALATVLAWGVRAAVLLIALLHPKIDARYHTRSSWRFDRERFVALLRVGGPTAAQWLIDIGAWVVFQQLMMPRFGTVALAASGIAIQYMHLSFMPGLGIGQALTSQVGFAIGEGRPDRAVQRVYIARRVILGYMALMGAVFLLFGTPLASLMCFEPDAATRAGVVSTAGYVLMWVALFQVSDGLCVTYSFALRGAGDTRAPALLFAWCCWGIFVTGGLSVSYFAPHWGVGGPWAMCTLYIIVLGVLLWRRFHTEEWRRIRLFDGAAGGPRPIDTPAGALGVTAAATNPNGSSEAPAGAVQSS